MAHEPLSVGGMDTSCLGTEKIDYGNQNGLRKLGNCKGQKTIMYGPGCTFNVDGAVAAFPHSPTTPIYCLEIKPRMDMGSSISITLLIFLFFIFF